MDGEPFFAGPSSASASALALPSGTSHMFACSSSCMDGDCIAPCACMCSSFEHSCDGLHRQPPSVLVGAWALLVGTSSCTATLVGTSSCTATHSHYPPSVHLQIWKLPSQHLKATPRLREILTVSVSCLALTRSPCLATSSALHIIIILSGIHCRRHLHRKKANALKPPQKLCTKAAPLMRPRGSLPLHLLGSEPPALDCQNQKITSKESKFKFWTQVSIRQP